MKYMFQYPEFSGSIGDMLDTGPVSELATMAEHRGWSGFAFTEHPAPSSKWLDSGGHQSLDPFAALAHVAAVTTRLTLLTYLSVLPYRNPSLLAKSAATVDRLSGGRFVLGAGTGYLKSEYFALGVDFDERNELFDEALDVLPLHWSGKQFDYAGKHFDCRGTIGLPKPVQQPIPIWIGGNSGLSLRRVAARAQGWMPLTGAPELFGTVRSPAITSTGELKDRLTHLRDLAGERFEQLEIIVAYRDDSIYEPTLDAERHREAFGELAAIGVTWLIIPGPPEPAPRTSEFLETVSDAFS